jgi:hypothetical protein
VKADVVSECQPAEQFVIAGHCSIEVSNKVPEGPSCWEAARLLKEIISL